MSSSHDSELIGNATGLAVIGLCSLPAVSSFIIQLRKRERRSTLIYEDPDGQSTPEAVKAFSNKSAKAIIVLLAVAGLFARLAHAVVATGYLVQNWASEAAWFFLVLQAVFIASTRHPVTSYNLGLYLFLSATILAIGVIVQGTRLAEELLHTSPFLFALRIIELVAVLALACASLAIPRRPNVYYNGKLVDTMYTVSAFTRFNFSWPSGILSLARKKKNLDMEDLPRPDHYSRARDVSRYWKTHQFSSHRLWLSVLKAHWVVFTIQWVLTLGTAFLNFAPQWVTLQLLRILESRHAGDTYGVDVWAWAFWLGVSIVAQAWLENYGFWISWAELSVPIRAQLSTLIFEKAMRKKDVKGTGASSQKESVTDDAEAAVAEIAGESTANDRPEVPAQEEADIDDDEAVKKGKQQTVNLIGVDSKRVADFCAYQQMFPGSVFRLVISIGFLASLLGWPALLAGLASMLAIMPVNIFFSKKYAAAQDRLMKIRDDKLEVVTEALQGIRQIKFSALEPEWEKKIRDVREKELGSVWDVFLADTALLFCWVTSPIALSAISLAVYAALYGQLIPSVAFVSLGVFRSLEVTLSVVPELTTDFLDAWTSINRIEHYLTSSDIEHVAKNGPEVAFENASIAWPADQEIDDSERFVLRDVTVTFPKGELSVISGKTGTGKSLVLSAILGEVDVLSGSLTVPQPPSPTERHDNKATKGNWIIPNSIAYVAQIPWIENASIKDNIVFGLPYDPARYEQTIEVCALKKDLEMLSDGEDTEIGANGINLSGGQKWRVTLARAIYSRAGILVMDDIFSAVDAHVGKHIFDKCLNGELAAGRTRILVTHHVALCEKKTKYLVELGDGRVLHAGLLSELEEDGTLEHIKSHEQTEEEIREDETAAATAVNSDDSADDEEEHANGDTLKKVSSRSQARKFVEEEKREEGAVKQQIYTTYLKDSGGWSYWLLAITIFVVVQGFTIGRSWWIRLWASASEGNEALAVSSVNGSSGATSSFTYIYSLQHSALGPATSNLAAAAQENNVVYYLSVYVGLAAISAFIGTYKYFYIYLGSIRASRSLFAKLNFVVLRAPLRWLDTVPLGRILNRFTADFHIIDSQLANSLSFGGGSFISLLGVIVAGLFVSPYITLLSLVLLLVCARYALLYLNGARPVKRLESNTKSPVFEQFGSALSGVSTIRGFDKAQTYIERMYTRLDDWSTATWHLWLFNRWVSWKMNLVGTVYSVFVAVLILATPSMDAALAGFALAFALEFANSIMWTVRLYANVELNMNAAERIIEYTELPTESLEGKAPPAAWPTQGRIEVDDLVVSYAPDLPPVLKGLTFNVNAQERVGVVGRTGAGKSSLTLALFRFLEARSGTIYIDGQDISKISLHDLRSRLAIIPQDPVLFSGTVRSNLDPFDHHSDAELRDCLERVHLISSGTGATTPTALTAGDGQGAGGGSGSEGSATPTRKNANVFEDLQSPVSEGGLNLSQGQRQLLCLARAIVSRPRVMVLDEATSAVDMHTDALIQRSIREEFTGSTLLVIAHRLSTIADFDRILVLSDGRVAEFGTPRELWELEVGEDGAGGRGIFRGMCEESGEREGLREVIFGKK